LATLARQGGIVVYDQHAVGRASYVELYGVSTDLYGGFERLERIFVSKRHRPAMSDYCRSRQVAECSKIEHGIYSKPVISPGL
jgi:hypothetical protein